MSWLIVLLGSTGIGGLKAFGFRVRVSGLR